MCGIAHSGWNSEHSCVHAQVPPTPVIEEHDLFWSRLHDACNRGDFGEASWWLEYITVEECCMFSPPFPQEPHSVENIYCTVFSGPSWRDERHGRRLSALAAIVCRGHCNIARASRPTPSTTRPEGRQCYVSRRDQAGQPSSSTALHVAAHRMLHGPSWQARFFEMLVRKASSHHESFDWPLQATPAGDMGRRQRALEADTAAAQQQTQQQHEQRQDLLTSSRAAE